MTRPLLDVWADRPRPIIGMLHLPALPGAPRYAGDPSAIREFVLRDAEALVAGGVDGLMMENFHDVPFFAGRVPAATVAHMTALAAAVRDACDVPLGINVLRNDGRSALAVAQAVGARFIRVNVLCAARVTDQGIIEGIAAELMRDRAQLGANGIAVWADVNVKHSAPLVAMPIEQEVPDLTKRGLADSVIVSGTGTGTTTDTDELAAVKAATGDVPVLIGSGITADNVANYTDAADGFIVGSSVKVDGVASNPVDQQRVKELVEAAQG